MAELLASKVVRQLQQVLIDHFCHFAHSASEGGADAGRSFFSGSEVTIELVDKKIDAVQLALAAAEAFATDTLSHLRYRRNQLSATHRRLPSELLSLIFEWTGGNYWPYNSPFTISRVSKLWRDVALNTPRLWTNIRLGPFDQLSKIRLGRSKSLPLDIIIVLERNTTIPRPSSTTPPPHIDRWRSLELLPGYQGRATSGEVMPWLRHPAPHLQVLHIQIDHEETARADIGYRDFDFDKEIFKGGAPLIHELSLQGLFVPFTMPIYTGLTKLRLCDLMFTIDLTVYQMLAAVATSPLLEDLYIGEIDTPDDFRIDGPFLSSPLDIHLPHLTSLFLGSMCASLMKCILGSVTIPPTSLLDLEFSHLEVTESPIEIFPRSPHNLRNLQHVHSLTVGASYGGCQVDGYNRDGGTLLTILAQDGVGSENSLRASLSTIPVQMALVHSFRERWFTRSPVTWSIGTPNSLETLYLHDCDPPLLRQLVSFPDNHPCPRLRSLGLSECSVSEDLLHEIVRSRAPAPGETKLSLDRVSLESLLVVDCPNITQPTLVDLWERVDIQWVHEGVAMHFVKAFGGIEEETPRDEDSCM